MQQKNLELIIISDQFVIYIIIILRYDLPKTLHYLTEPLAIDVYSRGCGGDVIPGCYNINQHDNLVDSALGNLADFLEDTDGAVCFCNDTDGCNNRPSDGIGTVPLVTTPTPSE